MRRPLMWICLSGIACIFILYKIILYCAPPPDIPETVTVSGQLVKKEYKNDNLVLYLTVILLTNPKDLYVISKAGKRL